MSWSITPTDTTPALLTANETGTPLRPKDAPKIPDSEVVRETITTETIYNCIAAPPPDAIRRIVDTLLETPDVRTCLDTINTLKAARGLALADIVTALAEELGRLEVRPEVMVHWLAGLAEIEHRVAAGGGEAVQTGAVVGVVRSGVELWRG